jgi:uncharacterized OB-fold protein
MKGPLQVIRRRRAEPPAADVGAGHAATEAPTEVQPSADAGATDAASQQPATEETPASNAPAGQDPDPGSPSFRHRGRLRRRLRYLRRVRELGFRDLGGLVFDQHRFAQANEELVRGKVNALAAVDQELRALERALDDRRPITELREPGISACPRCGGLHGSEARYCPSCGVSFRGPLAMAEVGEAVSLPTAEPAPPPAEPEPQPASTHVAEAEAAKAEADPQPTEIMGPVDGSDGDGEPNRFTHSSGSQP